MAGRLWPRTSGVALALLLAAGPALGQDSLPPVTALRPLLNAGLGDQPWEGRRRARLLAYYYGPAIKDLVITVLSEPTTRENVFTQRTALALPAYPRTGIPVSALLPFARGERPERGPLLGPLWTMALEALSGRPDTSLLDFWRGMERHPDVMLSQYAVGAYACMLGLTALPDLERIATSGLKHLPQIAQNYLRYLRTDADSAKVCIHGQASRSKAAEYPDSISPMDAQDFERLVRSYRLAP